MTTIRQKRVVKALIENAGSSQPKSAGQVLKSVGYGSGLQNQPKRVLESEGVKNELKVLGFTEEAAKGVVSEILHNPKVDASARLKAADQVFKVHGSYAPEKKDITTQGEKLPNTDLDALAELMAETLKQNKI